MTTCNETRRRLEALAFGGSDPDDGALPHARECGACGAAAAELLVLQAATRGADDGPPADLVARTRVRAGAAVRSRGAGRLRVAGLALVVLAFALGRWTAEPGTEDPAAPAQTVLVPEVSPSRTLRAPLTLDHHTYARGFLAGRTVTVR